MTPHAGGLDARTPSGPLETMWDAHRFEMKLVNPSNRRKYTVIVVGTVAPTAATAGPEIRNNTVTDSFIGFALAVEGANHVHGNDAHLNFAGILVIDSSANVIHDNDFRGNLEVDCFDETIGTGTAGTDNNWSDNLGNSNSPIGLCTADPV